MSYKKDIRKSVCDYLIFGLKGRKSAIFIQFLICLFLLRISSLACAQQLNSYYHLINEAELAICNESYEKAYEYYERVFQYYRPFTKDLKNAFIVNFHFLGNHEQSLEYAHQLIQRGYEDFPSFIIQDSTRFPDAYQDIIRMTDTTKRIYDTKLSEILGKIMIETQIVRFTCTDFPSVCEQKIRNKDKENTHKILQLYKTYPEINDLTVGYYFYTYTQSPFLYLAQQRDNSIRLLLKNEVMKGNYEATRFMDYADIYQYGNPSGIIIEDSLYGVNFLHQTIIDNTLFVVVPKNIAKINENRAKLNVAETWENYITKITYQFQTKKFYFHPLNYQHFGSDKLDEETAKWLRAEIDEEYKNGEGRRRYYNRIDSVASSINY